MDERVIRSMRRWPDVPAAYGWLSLDIRGRWRLEGSVVRNRTTCEAINRNYSCDERGCWYYQNGPQKVYATLEYTPWVYVLDGAGTLHTHTGRPVQRLEQVWVDDELALLLLSEHGIGVVSDQDTATMLDRFCDVAGEAMAIEAIESRLADAQAAPTGLYLRWQRLVPIERIRRSEVAQKFHFNPQPAAAA